MLDESISLIGRPRAERCPGALLVPDSVAQDLVGTSGIEIGQGAAPPADLEQGLCEVGGRAAPGKF